MALIAKDFYGLFYIETMDALRNSESIVTSACVVLDLFAVTAVSFAGYISNKALSYEQRSHVFDAPLESYALFCTAVIDFATFCYFHLVVANAEGP